MEQAPTLQELINIVKRVRTNWESLVQQIDQEKMTQPGVADRPPHLARARDGGFDRSPCARRF
jgi:hypothetical protein